MQLLGNRHEIGKLAQFHGWSSIWRLQLRFRACMWPLSLLTDVGPTAVRPDVGDVQQSQLFYEAYPN
jgi:hypothetical protein